MCLRKNFSEIISKSDLLDIRFDKLSAETQKGIVNDALGDFKCQGTL